MITIYNLTGISKNTTGILSLAQGVNEHLMFGYLGVCILIMATGISLMTFLMVTDDAKKSVAASSFIALTLSFLLLASNLISGFIFFIVVILCASSIAITWKLD